MPKHVLYGLSLFLALTVNGSAYAQKAKIPLPEDGQFGDTGVQTLLYVIPNDVEVRVERHWLTDSRLQFRMALLQRLLNEESQSLSVRMLRAWTNGQWQLHVRHNDDSVHGEVQVNAQATEKLGFGAVLWQDRCFTSGTQRQGVELRSQMQINDYTNVGVRITDSKGDCQNGCADMRIHIPL